ncbi:hypothetical protein PPACK8108_LOCUS14607 [Phakopsora pachyrhizi]|uniref:Uncharacterized protein n=1 Tax=Phakopsora pachyrhizi TaxID=170000 RepID=A0AAV0B8H2_PHAPC|nr:hypothetical protein PPACK8108_LOCUS14607 [Phakopsora pachyrhizi]
MQPSYSTIVTRMNESSGSVVVVPAAVLFQPRICRVEMIEWEEGPDKGTDQKSLTPCWKRRRGGWLNSPLLLSKRNPGSKELAEGEGEEENRRLVDPFDLLMGKDKYESIGQGVDDGPSWDESGRIEASPLGQVWAGVLRAVHGEKQVRIDWVRGEEGVDEGVVGSLLRLEAGLISGTPGCGESRVRSKEEENKSLLGQGWAGFMETTERLKRKPICRGRGIKVDVPVEAQSDLNQGIIVGEDFKDSFHLLGNLLVIYFCNGFKS